MIQGMWFDYAAALFAAISAFFWAWSALINVPRGFDTGAKQGEAFKKIGKLNATAAGFAAVAAVIPALKAFAVFRHLVAA